MKVWWRTTTTAVLRLHENTKLKYKLMWAYSLLFMTSIVFVGMTSYYHSRDFMTQSEKNAAAQSMIQLHNAIDSFLEMYFNKSEMVFFNLQLQKHLSAPHKEIDDLVYTLKDINDTVNQMMSDVKRPYLKHSNYLGGNLQLLLYTKNPTLFSDGQTIFKYDEIKDAPWNRWMLDNDMYFVWESGVRFSNQTYIALNRRLIDFGTSTDLGVMRLLIPVDRIQNIIDRSLGHSDYLLVYSDEEGRRITSYGPIQSGSASIQRLVERLVPNAGVSEEMMDGTRYLAGVMKSDMTNWKLLYMTRMDNITNKVNRITYSIIVSVVVSVVLCIFVALLISTYMTRRIDVLVRKTDMAKQGNLIISDVIRGNDEIGRLDQNFNGMMERIRHLIEVEYKSQLVLNHTKLELLQEQINPHLHYNTLAMIAALAHQSNQTDIYEVANHLIDFYRTMLNKGKLVIALADEFEMLRHYLELSKFAYSLELDIVIEVEEEVLSCYSVKMLLQPLVENAIFHGIKPLRQGTVIIGGRPVEDGIELYVSDDGAGMPEYKLEYVNSLPYETGERHGCGYGLTNVYRRLQLFFGDSFRFECESAQGMGTTFIVFIPRFTEQEIQSFLGKKLMHDEEL
ncbi:HAMP domain-containing protein [Paenibacillus sp. H1-7]|uniref:sensor histidine kinase n=1 Tax=Paenibacillus sp. H1-7 TaxID=2282849 RepID=UPI001EF8DE24|nr:histidine kinase [Paenibacillus sp. H1-7]ULL15246.1 HAMP domain-containing protein [Paenibacillus sp. H1-7]